VTYDDCYNCAATSFFTAFYYSLRDHMWAARWLRGGQGVPIWAANTATGVTRTQVYAMMADANGRETLGTWNHLDYGAQRPAEDFVYRYDLDPSGQERMQLLGGKEASNLKERLCHSQDIVAELSRGQDSALCQTAKKTFERKPVTTPPANNEGQSRPPGARR
jgi:hypothetical protein